MPSSPTLSVGLPVYNAQAFLAKALDSILSQTFTDFELLLSDNASTDATESICRDYARRDSRIRYFRNPKNMGAGWNFQRVYSIATGRYYKQAAHDDFCEPAFFANCIRALEEDPGVTVAYTKTRIVDVHGEFLEDYECPLRTASDDPVIRFEDLVLTGHRCFQVFGIHRMSALRQLPPMGSFAHADRILLAQLGLLGRFYECPERLFISTRHPGQSVWTMPQRMSSGRFRLTQKPGTLPALEWWDPSKARKIAFPECNAFARYCWSVRNSPLTLNQKIRAFAVMARWARKYHRRLLGDFVLAADHLIWNLQSLRPGQRPQAETKPVIDTEGGKTA
jgi:glycosyltransferase involved in cell wall biosynthesis